MLIPTLYTERLILRPPSDACATLYALFYTDAEASHHYGGPLTDTAAGARLAADIEAWRLQDFGVWAIERRDSGALIGVCGYWQGQGWPRELTWWLLPEARGAGVAQEASRAVIAHAYCGFKWPTVETYMNDENDAARALVLRLGGVATGRRVFPDGLKREVYVMPSVLPQTSSDSPE